MLYKAILFVFDEFLEAVIVATHSTESFWSILYSNLTLSVIFFGGESP